MDELWCVGFGEELGDFLEESLAFGVAVGAEARGDGVQVAVVVAGMAAEFVGAGGWQSAENFG